MSKLKARRAYFSEDEYERGAHKICAKVSDCGYDKKNDWWSYAFEDEVYIKSEADNVISELKDKALQYKVLYKEKCRDINNQEQHFAKQLYHNKYKRCLAMAKWCESEAYIHEYGSEYDENLVAWFGKWYERWLKIAEKFKEAK